MTEINLSAIINKEKEKLYFAASFITIRYNASILMVVEEPFFLSLFLFIIAPLFTITITERGFFSAAEQFSWKLILTSAITIFYLFDKPVTCFYQWTTAMYEVVVY